MVYPNTSCFKSFHYKRLLDPSLGVEDNLPGEEPIEVTSHQTVSVCEVAGLDDGADCLAVAVMEIRPDQLHQLHVRVLTVMREVSDVCQLHSTVSIVKAEDSLELLHSGVLVGLNHHHHLSVLNNNWGESCHVGPVSHPLSFPSSPLPYCSRTNTVEYFQLKSSLIIYFSFRVRNINLNRSI